MASILGTTYFLGAIIGLIVLVCFFVLCYNVGRIARYLQILVHYDQVKLIEEGHLSLDPLRLTKWIFNGDKIIRREVYDNPNNAK